MSHYLGRSPAIGTQKVLDSLESQFNGSLTTFDLRYNTNTIYPPIASALIVSLGGVLQEPGVAYTVASDTITFASAPPAGTDCWILLYTEFGAAVGGAANLTISNNLTIGNELHGPANFVIDPATIGDNTGTVEIKGNLTVQGTQTTVNSTTVDLDHLSLGDNEIANFGNGNDLRIFHDGSNNYIQGTSGNLILKNNSSDYFIGNNSSGSVELNYNNSKKFETTSAGINVQGDIRLRANNYLALSEKQYGYGTSYSSIMVGNPNDIRGNVALAVDTSTIVGGNFNGYGQVIFTRQGGLAPNNANNNFIGVYGYNSSDSLILGPITSSGYTSGPLTLTTTGNVGIGTNNPGGKLEIKTGSASGLIIDSEGGSIYHSKIVNSSGDLILGSRTTSGDTIIVSNRSIYFKADDDETTKVTIRDTGRVGINRITPSFMLDIIGNSSTGANCIRITDGAETGHGSHPAKIVAGGTYYHEMQMHSRRFTVHTYNGSSIDERFRVHQNGNVGIGTDNPFTKLDTRGALHVGGGSDGIWLGNAGDNSAYDNIKLYYTGYNSGSPRIYLTPRTQPGSGNLNTYLHLLSYTGVGSNNMGLLVDGNVGIGTNSPGAKLDVNGDVFPTTDATHDLGSASKRWANIYSADLQLSNEGSANDVDGTWGAYTIQEGEEELFLINRRSGKKFKFVLEEVN